MAVPLPLTPANPHCRSRRLHLLSAATLACVSLAGCTAHADLTVHAAGTYDVHLELRDSTGAVYPSDSDDAATRCTSLTDPSLVGAPSGISVTATPIGQPGDDAGLGCEVTITGVSIPDADASPAPTPTDPAPSTASSAGSDAPRELAEDDSASTTSAPRTPLVARNGDLYVVDLSAASAVLTGGLTGLEPSQDTGADAAGPTDSSGSGFSQAGSGSPSAGASPAAPSLSAVDVRVSVTFPGAVVDAGGGKIATNGRTVTWTGAETVAAGIRATGYVHEGASLTWWQRHHTQALIVLVSACVLAGGAVIIRRHRTGRRR